MVQTGLSIFTVGARPLIKPLPVKGLTLEGSLFESIAKKDYLQYTPYHTFSYIIKFLREAALDPKVKNIKITVYRLANNSQVAASLINAVKNGKHVTVQIELQARFDEQAIYSSYLYRLYFIYSK